MPDLDRDPGLVADAYRFVDRCGFGVSLAAHVRGVNAAVFGCFARERDQLVGLGVGRRRILQRAGDADGTILHGVIHEQPHLRQLVGRRLHVGIAEHHAAHAGGAHIACEVDAHALVLKAREVFAERGPVGMDVQMFKAGAVSFNDGGVEGRGGVAFAGDLGCDSLVDLRRNARIHQHGQFRLSQHVDESGCDNLAVSVDGLLAGRVFEIADGGDASGANAHVAGIPG